MRLARAQCHEWHPGSGTGSAGSPRGVLCTPVHACTHTGHFIQACKGTMGPIMQIMANWPTGRGAQSPTQPRLGERASSLPASQDRYHSGVACPMAHRKMCGPKKSTKLPFSMLQKARADPQVRSLQQAFWCPMPPHRVEALLKMACEGFSPLPPRKGRGNTGGRGNHPTCRAGGHTVSLERDGEVAQRQFGWAKQRVNLGFQGPEGAGMQEREAKSHG